MSGCGVAVLASDAGGGSAAPVRSDGFLPADVPHVELQAVVHERFDVEALRGRDGCDVLVRQLLEDGGFARVVQP